MATAAANAKRIVNERQKELAFSVTPSLNTTQWLMAVECQGLVAMEWLGLVAVECQGLMAVECQGLVAVEWLGLVAVACQGPGRWHRS